MSNKSIYSELQAGNLVDALVMLKSKVERIDNWQLQQDLEQATDTYNTLLSYMAKGVEDPEAKNIRLKLIQQAYSINDRANRLINLRKTSTDKYTLTYNTIQSEELSVQNLHVALETLGNKMKELHASPNSRESIQQHDMKEVISQHDMLIGKLFDYTWTSEQWKQSDYANYTDFFNSDQVPDNDKAVIVSALMMACFNLFDPQKLMLLFDAYLDENPEISQRALVGLLLLIMRYDNRLSYYPQIQSRFSLYSENGRFVEDCFHVFMQLQYSKMTDTVSIKMSQNIMPALLKSSRYKPINLQNIGSELTKNGENPEWLQNDKDDTLAEKKMRQMAEMQTEGADVYWSAFRSLKSFHFFADFHHWFTPFSFEYPDSYEFSTSTRPEIEKTVKMLFSLSPFCSSDMFSFIYMLESVKQMGQDVIAQQLNAQMGEEGTQSVLDSIKPRERTAKEVSRRYIFDLYRVFKGHPAHYQLFDPFNPQLLNFSPLNFNLFKPLVKNYNEVLSLAEFMMRRGAYQDAIMLFRHLDPQVREEDSDIWQKIGFCHQKTGDSTKAIFNYKIAHQLNPKSEWTLLHLAQTCFDEKAFEACIGYIDEILANDENNIKWLSRKAECLFGMEKYEESLPILYKLAYLDENQEKTKEMLAWGLLMTGNMDKATKIHTELMEENPSVRNNIFLAHLLLQRGDAETAYNLYTSAYQLAQNEDEFQRAFWEWDAYLERIGLNKDQMQLMSDAVRMLQNND